MQRKATHVWGSSQQSTSTTGHVCDMIPAPVLRGQINPPLDNRQLSTVSGTSATALSCRTFILFVSDLGSKHRAADTRLRQGPWRKTSQRQRHGGHTLEDEEEFQEQRAAQITDTGSWKGPWSPLVHPAGLLG